MAPYSQRLTQWFDSLQRVARWKILVAVAILGSLLIISRQPEVVFHPRFWAEDGTFWYADAWNIGWTAIFRPHTGYLQTISRLTALVAVQFPLYWGPTIFVIVAWAAQLAPLLYWFSKRFDRLVPRWTARLFIGFLYVGLPNSYEVNMNLTNAQWHLALVSFLIIFADAPVRRWAQVRDLVVLAVAGLSGPFSILLWPVAAWYWYKTRSSWGTRTVGVLTMTALTQGFLLLFNIASGRPHPPLGASIVSLSRIIGGQVGMGSLLSIRGYAILQLPFMEVQRRVRQASGISLPSWVLTVNVWHDPVVPVITTVLMILCAWISFRKAPSLLRSFLGYVLIVFAASLATPANGTSSPQWPLMAHVGTGDRYYFLPILAWLILLVSAAYAPSVAKLFRTIPKSLIILAICVGVPFGWVYPARSPVPWVPYVRQITNTPRGTVVVVPIDPHGWSMRLRAR